ncbi:hypothetical protein [Catellatospora citrea]|uniref:Polyketide cyclase n=1 Tax=Catellatospora citrea TaxID=53366 RepID=A0A8J3NZD6_9ACTN|nr:hypothetical protein [Catellatospora citrea]RKE05287.1 hypothetical protein C8E86_0082 [Catellatospora citrea]GIF98217.1 polyketide cyclase [Catellatospora citrea]
MNGKDTEAVRSAASPDGSIAADGGSHVQGDIVRVLAGADMVAAHTVYPSLGPDGFVGFDIFRMQDGSPAEHWRAAQPLAAHSANGHSQFDGPAEVLYPGQVATTRKVVDYYVDRVLLARDHDLLCRFVVTDLVQHDPALGNGIGPMWAALADADVRYTRHTVTVADGEFALTACTGSVNDTPTAFYDLYRLEHAMIAEHWNVITVPSQPMPYSVTHPRPGPEARP